MSWQQKGFPAVPWSSPRTPTGASHGSTDDCSRRRRASRGAGTRSVFPLRRLRHRRARRAGAGNAGSLIVLMHPIQWYSMPALLKLWLDEVLTYGWAYGPGGSALKGKDLWLVATTGGPERFLPPRRATTATSSTPSCRPTSRPRYCAACASCHPSSCTVPFGRAKRPWPATCSSSRTACVPIRNGPSSPSSSRARRAKCPLRTGRASPAKAADGTRACLAYQQLDLPERGGDCRAGVPLPWLGLDHWLSGRGHCDRALGPGPGAQRGGHPALRRVRCRADAVPGGPGAGTAAPVEPAPADLRLGQRPGAGMRRPAVRRCDRRRPAVASQPGCGAGAGAVVHRDRLAGDARAQPAAHRQRAVGVFHPAVPGRRGDSHPCPAASFGQHAGSQRHGRRRPLARSRQDCCRRRRHRPGRASAAAAPAALDRQEQDAGDIHRRIAPADRRDRRADAIRGPVDGAGGLSGGRAAGRKRIPARAGNRHRAVQRACCWACSSSPWE